MWSNGFNVSIVVVVVFFALAQQQPTYLYSFVRVQVFQFKWFFLLFRRVCIRILCIYSCLSSFWDESFVVSMWKSLAIVAVLFFRLNSTPTQRFSSFQVECKAQKHKAIMLLTNRENNYPMDLGFNIVASIIIISSPFSTFTSKS